MIGKPGETTAKVNVSDDDENDGTVTDEKKDTKEIKKPLDSKAPKKKGG